MRRTLSALSGLVLACALTSGEAKAQGAWGGYYSGDAARYYGDPYAPQAAPRGGAYYGQQHYQPYGQQPAYETYRPQAVAPARRVVAWSGREAPGTIVISTAERRLRLVLGNGRAMEYAIGVGRPGFTWTGTKTVTMKREWPDWRPPAQMLKRRPDLPRYMSGGPDNPLGARALYLGGSLYRIHGSNEPETIGEAVSSGCFRMTNADVVDLYSRVRVGTRVVVR
ncbi:MAG TPA: L,D-transpeptidase [Beijerinckiaceae bacterium]|nr:L,D-transpeptidase [Beijerinckiaceae bacterium]